MRSFVIAAAIAAGVAGTAHGAFFQYQYNRNGGAPAGPTAAGIIDTINTTYDPTAKRFTWDVTVGDGVAKNTNGYWLVVSPGANPRTNAREYVIIFFDATSAQPKVSLFGYRESAFAGNAVNPASGDFITSTLVAGENRIQAGVSNAGNARTFTLGVDAATINSFFPDADWKGIQFGPKLGTWFHNTINTTATYNGNQRLTRFAWSDWGFWDFNDLPTTLVPAPGTAALLAAGGLVLTRRRRTA